MRWDYVARRWKSFELSQSSRWCCWRRASRTPLTDSVAKPETLEMNSKSVAELTIQFQLEISRSSKDTKFPTLQIIHLQCYKALLVSVLIETFLGCRNVCSCCRRSNQKNFVVSITRTGSLALFASTEALLLCKAAMRIWRLSEQNNESESNQVSDLISDEQRTHQVLLIHRSFTSRSAPSHIKPF